LIPIDSLSADALAHAFKRPSLGREETHYITCHTGPRALQAAERLQQAGFDNLSLIEDGTRNWQQLGLPLERCGRALSPERQGQIAVGSLLVLKVFLGRGGEALLIDPVLENTARYVRLLEELDVKLVMAADTHIHADQVTALGALRNQTGCASAMGAMTGAECISVLFHEGEKLCVENLHPDVLCTPGHTDDPYSLLLPDRVFTGDTLLIRGTGRTDFHNGDPAAQYDSLFGKLLTLPEDTLVYPAHDCNGMTVSTIGEEKRHNPRLQVADKQSYIELMNGLEVDDPKLMDFVYGITRRSRQNKLARVRDPVHRPRLDVHA
jgi:glyoxylase-like metal-dependent hydrolase (beta-lactamase superfamily II)